MRFGEAGNRERQATGETESGDLHFVRSGFRGREHNESAFEPLCEWEEHWQTGATELSGGPDQLRPDTFIRGINGRRGTTVLLMTHDLGDG